MDVQSRLGWIVTFFGEEGVCVFLPVNTTTKL